jgi:hypothetical protein
LRTQLIDDMRSRVRAAVDGDFAPIMAAEAAANAAQLLRTVPEPAADLEVAAAAGWFHWLRFTQLGPSVGDGDLNAAVELLAGVYERNPGQVPEPMQKMYQEYSSQTGRSWASEGPDELNERASKLYSYYESTYDLVSLGNATQLVRQAVDATTRDDPDRAGYLGNLAGMLQETFERTGDLNTLIDAAQAARDALACLQNQHPSRTLFLANISAVLRSLFEETGDVGALDEGIRLGREAAEDAGEDDPVRAFCCSVFAQCR